MIVVTIWAVLVLMSLPVYKICKSIVKNKSKSKIIHKDFFSSISDFDRKKWIAQEHYLRTKLNISTITDSTFLKFINTPGKRLRNNSGILFNYDIL